MTKNKIILFDLDGTLIDSTEAVMKDSGELLSPPTKEFPTKNLSAHSSDNNL